jgi:hypothetical protein
VPVITAKNAPGLPFLRNLHWIQTPDPATPGPIETIVGAMHGEAGLPAAPEPWRTINPYRGLLALKEEDADFFFGREAETTAVLEAITGLRYKVISLVGNSGVGKSSLVQAGIIGALKRQRPIGAAQRAWPEGLKESRRWAYLTMKPGADPVQFEIAAPSSGSITIRMSSDGRFALTTDGGSTVDLWSLQPRGAPSLLETFSEKSPVKLVAFGEGVPAFVIMTKTGLARAVLIGDDGKTENVLLHEELKFGKMQDNGAVFAGAGPDGTVHFWNLATGRASKAPVDPERERSNLAQYDLDLPNGEIAGLRCGSDVVEIWDIDEGRLVSVINAAKSLGSNAGMSLSVDGRRALLEHDDSLSVWDTGTGALVKKITPKKYNLYDWQRLNDTGSRLLIVNESRVDLYDASTGALILSLPGQNSRSGFADGGTRLLVKGMNGSVELRDAAAPQ